MLSIGAMGKAGSDTGDYYVNLAREDYYTKGGEPMGQWYGQGAEQLHLVDHVQRQDLREILNGINPANGEPLVQVNGPRHATGWDLTFSAPKSVSVLWSQAGPTIRAEIQAAQQAAVERALTLLQDHAAFTRRGHAGVTREPVTGLVVAMFEHSTSREQDPQLHTHCLVANVAPRRDSTWGSLESRHFYQWKMAAGAFYRAELAQQLRDRLHIEMERDERSFRLPGVPRDVEHHFSKRRQQIKEQLHHFAATTAASAAVATLQSREQKDAVNRADLFARWQQEGREHGFGPEAIDRCWMTPTQDRLLPELTPEAALTALTQTASTFTERDLWRLMAEHGQGVVGATGVKALVEQTWRHHDLVRLGPDNQGMERYSTREMVMLEKNLVEQAQSRGQESRHRVPDHLVQAVLKERLLSPEQTVMVRHLTQGTAGVACVVGMAGTGKSYALDAVRDAWEQAGYRVSGAALAGKAAQGLQEAAHIPSTTIHALLQRLENGQVQLDSRDVLVIDEAGMVGSRPLKQILDYAHAAGAKVALIGDDRQLQPIDAGGAFRLLKEHLGAPALTDIRRQRKAWDRETVHQFANGAAAQALARYHDRGRLIVAGDRAAAIHRMAQDWLSDRRRDATLSAVLLTDTRQESRQLNDAVRDGLKAEGLLGAGVVVNTIYGMREFATGDRMLFTRNSRLYGVSNGTLGTLERIRLNGQGEPALEVRLDDGRLTRIRCERYRALDHGYALTTHKAQGVTVDHAYVLTGGPMADRELTYVQMSRHRDAARLYVDRPTVDELVQAATPPGQEHAPNLTRLARALSQSHPKDTTHDYASARAFAPPPGMDRDRDIPLAEPPARERDREHELGLDF